MAEVVYMPEDRRPYGGPNWKELMEAGRLDACLGGQVVKVRQEGSLDGNPRFVANVSDHLCAGCGRYHDFSAHTTPGDWYPVAVASAMMVEHAAKAALGQNEKDKLERRKRDEDLIELELVAIAEEMGLVDIDVLHMAPINSCKVVDTDAGPVVHGVRECLEKFRREKPHFFKEVRKPKGGAANAS